MCAIYLVRRILSNCGITGRLGLATLVTLITLTTSAESSRRDTTSPNEFWFSNDVYYVEEGATSAVISVEFYPGDRSWSGSVDYKTSDGTATAPEDYTAVSGTLNFSGPGTPIPQIVIPISKNNLAVGETVQISLSNPYATITRSNATLIIVKKAPVLKINAAANGTVSVTWPSDSADYSLEKSSQPSGANWIEVSSAPSLGNGTASVTEPCSPSMVFYRLRKIATP